VRVKNPDGQNSSWSSFAVTAAVGLDIRPTNLTCIAPERPSGSGPIAFEDAFPTIGEVPYMTKVLQSPDSAGRWFFLEQRGKIMVFDADDPENIHTWLDFTPDIKAARDLGELGFLLGLTFHPDYPNTPEVFVYYTGAPNGVFESVLLRVTLDDIDAPLNPVVEQIFTLAQDGRAHKGGDIVFDPDGYLYLGIGDGGTPQGQDTTNLYATMMRIDVTDTGAGYNLPADNPFSGNPSCAAGPTGFDCPEIFAWGLRNPYRFSFDDQGRLFVGDVGRRDREEINLVESGKNYGWPCREGTLEYSPTEPPADKDSGCLVNDVPMTAPIHEYQHPVEGASVTGGFVYQGTELPFLQGKYIFADFVSGQVWALTEQLDDSWTVTELGDSTSTPPSLAEGNNGEIYLGDRGTGHIQKLVVASGGGNTIPTNLVDTGCVDPVDPTQPASGLIPYEINAPFWPDGAVKSRYMAIPDGTTIDINSQDDWEFPSGSVLLENFQLNGQLIETRLFMRHPDGVWGGYTYEWNDAGTAATRVIGGKSRNINGQTWVYPSEGQCMVCHTGIAGFSLGPETAQMNREAYYPSPGNGEAHQLLTLDHINLFTAPLPPPESLPQLTNPYDTSAGLNDRARSWLQTNCAQCHQPGGPTPSSMDLRYTTPLGNMNACNISPQAGDLGIIDPLLIAPGEADRSIVFARMNRRDEDGMPPLGSTIVDADGALLLTDWINSLGNCPGAIGDQTVAEGSTLTLNLSAPEGYSGDALSFSVVPAAIPYGIFTDNGDGSATWVLTPGPGDAGIVTVTVTVTDTGTGLSNEETFTLTVVDPSAALVSGVVKNSVTLLPIEGALVTLQTTTTQTSTAADGSFTLDIASGTDLVIVGASKGYYNASVTTNLPTTDAEILLTPVTIGTNASYSFVEPTTCAFCHPDQKSEWDNSAMANAGINTWVHDIYDGTGTPGGMGGFVYTRDSVFAGTNPNSECAACHQPESWVIAGYSGRMEGPNDAGYPSTATAHGISCETCHKIANVDTQKIDFPGIFPGAVTFNQTESGTQVQYGLLPDVDYNLSGAMEPSYQPQLAAEVCGACHQDANDINEDHTFAGVISEPTYTEWAQSPYGDADSALYRTCIDCHMPPSGHTDICTFVSLARDPNTVRTHAIEGTTAAYLDNAVELSMQTQLVGNELRVDVSIDNSLTGHHVPTGVTVRNMILLVEAWQDGQDPLINPLIHTGTQTIHDLGGIGDPAQGYYAGLPGKFYAKVNHDASLQDPTFFTDATGIQFDNRIPALGTDMTNYTFSIPGGSGTIHVRARLIYRRAFRFLVDAKSWTQDGHGNPLEDMTNPHYGHLMELATEDVSF
jgi:uncharacterized repeat protein (TIGR03806 family)